jgi:hypothetical protein
MFFNGGNMITGGSDESYNQYSKVISTESAKKSQVNISGTFEANSVNASVTNLGSGEIKNVKLMAVTFENLGTSEHRYTVREILTPNSIAILQSRVAQKFSFKPGSTGSNIKIVLFLQSASGEILQSALVRD